MVFSAGHAPATVTSLKVTEGVEQLSEEVAVPVLAGSVLAMQATVTFAGQVTEGAIRSFTEMDCAQLAELPHSSVALQVRVIT